MGHPPKKLLDQVRDAIRLKHYSIRTEETYVDWIRHFILFHGKRHPRQMGTPEIEAFLTLLARPRSPHRSRSLPSHLSRSLGFLVLSAPRRRGPA